MKKMFLIVLGTTVNIYLYKSRNGCVLGQLDSTSTSITYRFCSFWTLFDLLIFHVFAAQVEKERPTGRRNLWARVVNGGDFL